MTTGEAREVGGDVSSFLAGTATSSSVWVAEESEEEQKIRFLGANICP